MCRRGVVLRSALVLERLDASVASATLCSVHRQVFGEAQTELGDGDHIVPVMACLLLPATKFFVVVPTLFYGIKVDA